MGVDFDKKRKILIIHGVQRGSNKDQTQHKIIEKNVKKQLGNINIPFETKIFKYEDLNDNATSIRLLKRVLASFTGNTISGWIVKQTVDLAGDVGIALKRGPTYKLIKSELTKSIIDNYNDGNPLYLIAHSLGTIYAFDVINDLMRKKKYFKYNQIETRPVLGLITLGSPLALDLFSRGWRNMTSIVPPGKKVNDDFKLFRWMNYWDPTDPIVSGNLAGLPWKEKSFKEKFRDNTYELGWDVRSRKLLSGKGHLAAHTSYWKDEYVGKGIRQMLKRRS